MTPDTLKLLAAVAWWSFAWSFVWSGAMFYCGYLVGKRDL
jgi:hypothetical protein